MFFSHVIFHPCSETVLCLIFITVRSLFHFVPFFIFSILASLLLLAMGVAETLLKENSNRTEILARILPNMASAADARMLVAKLLNNNKIEVQKLRREVGFALKPMLGKILHCL